MRDRTPAPLVTLAVLLCAGLLPAQAPPAPTPLLRNSEALALFKRAEQLAESTAAAIPGLVRAAAPVQENIRQDYGNLERGPANNAGFTYSLLVNLRAYLSLAESVPKPFPFPEEGRRQFVELRESVDRIETHFRALLELKERQLRSPDRDNLARYAEANARVSPPAPGQPRVVFLGDSITDGWRLNEYYPGRDFVNRGISGQITGEMLGRMKADVIDLRPTAVILLAGTNDLARGVSLQTIQNNISMIADLADKHNIKVLLASILPVSDYHKGANPSYERTPGRPPAQILAMNQWIQQFCKARGYRYVDYFQAMVDQTGMIKAEYADDGLHPNSLGYRVMAPVALAAIDSIASPREPQPSRKRR